MRVIIIGNGIAANSAAQEIRKFSPRAEVILISEEPFPLYSACILPDYLGRKIERERIFLKKMADYSLHGIQALLGHKVTALHIHEKAVIQRGNKLKYDKLIMATGGEVISSPIVGSDKPGIFTFKTLSDADQVLQYRGKRAVVVGSGPIGVEVAIAFSKQGCQVTLIELMDDVLPRVFDPHPARLVREQLEDNGIAVLTGEKVIEFTGSRLLESVLTDKRRIECDCAILALGVKANTSLASGGGLEVGKLGGIETDHHMLTSADDIYACGDCAQSRDRITGTASLSQLWHNAKIQGEIAGCNVAGKQKQYAGSLDVTVLNIFNTQAVSIGKTYSGLDDKDTEILEREMGDRYYRLIISQKRLCGIQLIGQINDVGFLLNMMLRKDDPKKLQEKMVDIMRGSFPVGWQYKAVKYWSAI